MDSLRKLQLIELNILKEFIRICEEHNLKYFAIGGTALGAVRHKGFIPWDDDIDVSMPREDYDKFYKIVSKMQDGLYEAVTIYTHENHTVPIMKFIDKNVVMVSKMNTKIKNKSNAFIDIFPMDGLPNNKIARYIHVRRFLVYRSFFLISIFDRHAELDTKNKPRHYRLILWACNKFNLQRLFNSRKMACKGDSLLKRHDYYKKDFCSPQLWGQYKTRAVFPAEWFGEGALLPFEDIQVFVPAHVEKYLGQLYGSNYMELPPVEKRWSHSSEIEWS